jgi:hypothetical protein
MVAVCPSSSSSKVGEVAVSRGSNSSKGADNSSSTGDRTPNPRRRCYRCSRQMYCRSFSSNLSAECGTSAQCVVNMVNEGSGGDLRDNPTKLRSSGLAAFVDTNRG